MLRLEGIFPGHGLDAPGVEEGEVKVEPAQHFHQPLMDQAVRYNNKHTLGTLGE